MQDRNNVTWEQFSSKLQSYQVGFMGEPNEVKPGKGEFHENPTACICEDSDSNAKTNLSLLNQIHHTEDVKENNNGYKETNNLTNEQTTTEDDQEWTGLEYLDIGGDFGEKRLTTITTTIDSDLGVQANPERPELEELFSD